MRYTSGTPLCRLACLSILGIIWPSLVSAAVPTPLSVLGKNPGDDFYLASYDDSKRYFEAAAQTSDRIKLFTIGKTTAGADFIIAVISAPENLKDLDRYKAIEKKLAEARGLTDAQALALAQEGKAIVHIDGGLHSSEVAGGQHSIQLAYKLLAAQGDPDVDMILKNVILVLYPSLNPDGQNLIARWYMQNVGTPYEVSPMPWLYQEYVGHDNNRDGYMQNMLEEQEISRTELDYNPVIFYCQHQSAPFPARIWIPPFSAPISSNINPLMLRWLNVIGTNMAAYLDAHQLPGSMHRGGFDNWYPGFTDFIPVFRNEISFFTETALYRYATPHFYTVSDFPKGANNLRTDVDYGSSWKGGWWRLADAVRYMVGGSMSVLDTAARYREVLLYNRYQAGRDNIARFRKEPPFAYIISSAQRDVPEAALLAQKMIDNGVEVHRAPQSLAANGRDYPAGSWVILMDQPYAPLAKELIERQKYPQGDDGKALDHRPYDVTGWTLPLQMGVEVAPVTTPLSVGQRSSLEPVQHVTPSLTGIQGGGSRYLLSACQNASFHAVNQILQSGASVLLIPGDNAGCGAKGSNFLVSGLDRSHMDAIARAESIAVSAATQAPSSKSPGLPVSASRIALYRPWSASIDEGWTRWILKNYDFASVSLSNGDIQAGHLRDRFDTIILPDIAKKALTEGYEEGLLPGEYAGGIGDEGISALREFVQSGGTLVTLNQASSAIVDLLHLPVKNVLQDVKPEQFNCPGALLKVQMAENARPVLAGTSREMTVMFENGPAFEPQPGFEGLVIASYPKDASPLESGYILHPELLQGKAAALEMKYGEGRIFLFGFKPQWRAQSHSTYKLLFSTLYSYRGLPSYPAPLKTAPFLAAPDPAKSDPAKPEKTSPSSTGSVASQVEHSRAAEATQGGPNGR